MNIRRQIQNSMLDNLDYDIENEEYHTEYNTDISRVNTENHDLMIIMMIVVILSIIAMIVTMIVLFYVFKSNIRSMLCAFYEFILSFSTHRTELTSNKDSKSSSYVPIPSSSQDLNVFQSCVTIQSHPEYRSALTQTNDHTSSSESMELRQFVANSEVVYGYLALPPPEFRTTAPKPKRKCLSDRHTM